MKEAEVVLVADLDEARLASIKSRYAEIDITTDYHDLFTRKLDAVVVATPPTTHYAIARDCLEHGLHVLVEKPLTLNSRDAEALIEVAEQHDRQLMVGHTFEYNPAVRVLKEIIESGKLGEIYHVDAVRVNLGLFQKGLDVIWDLAPHDLSILRYILGADPVTVSACAGAHILPGINDLAYIHLEFPNNITAHVHVSWLDPCKVRRITVVGSEKMLVYDDVEPLEKIRIYDKCVEKPSYTHTFADFQFSYRYGDITIPHIKFTEPLRIECQHFIDSIVNGTTPQSSGYDGLQVVRMIELAEQSLCPESVPFVEQRGAHGYVSVHNK
jgi:predicted dehydrogenase